MLAPRFLLSALLALAATPALPAGPVALRPAVTAPHGMVVSAQGLASQVGADILQQGGNAVDAAVATGFALAVVYPWAGNLGGGGFMLIHLNDGRDLAIDYRETAPAAASRDMYLDAQGNVLKGLDSSTRGWRASGVPGTVAGFAYALKKYGSGKISWAAAIEPARRLAAEGFILSPANAALFARSTHLADDPETKRVFLHGGAGLSAGQRLVQPDLAATLARLQSAGSTDFYTGVTAQKIAAAMTAHHGTITLADLAAYRVVEREPLRQLYRDYIIVTMPPPSSGGTVLLQMLAMLEPCDVPALGQDSAAKYHLFAEVMKRAYRDRAEYFADPAFVPVPVLALLDRDYLRHRMETFSPDRATPATSIFPGLGPFLPPRRKLRESHETTHFSIVDAEGNAVANTYTLNGGFGSGITVPGTGMLLNNEMDDFTAKPGVPNAYQLIQGTANAIAPGKRPLSSMTPTIVLGGNGPLLVTGSPGGSSIPNTVLQVITNVLDFNLPVDAAVAAPRINHQWMPDTISYEPDGLDDDTISALRTLGHHVALRNYSADTQPSTTPSDFFQGDAETIFIDPGTLKKSGASDPRKPDARAIGY